MFSRGSEIYDLLIEDNVSEGEVVFDCLNVSIAK